MRKRKDTMAKYPTGLLEEELKNKVAADWFAAYDTTRIIGKIDFCVAIPATELGLFEAENALWAEAKAGVRKDIHESFVQLILTIGRARTFDSERPPIFLGAFDAEKIAFIPFAAVQDVFAQNDFNWNVPPSNHESKEFAQLHALAEKTIAAKSLLFDFESDEAELRKFIKANFKTGRKDVSRIQIDKNNFTHIYRKWREAVLPHIDAPWDVLKKKYSLYDRDFYLAELNVDDNGTADISDDKVATDFYITFNANGQNKYRIQRKNADELSIELTFGFKSQEGVAAYAAFWGRYKRPPRKDYWNYIVKRLDLLVPQDVRERKGAFFTPQKWVELSQEYLAKELGENWQDEYDLWDCCAGTGNMEAGLTNKYKVWASTLDQQDVDVIRERIKNGANLLESHVFQFDFLNDSFDKLPEGLRQIVNDPERRKKLVVYINPPYAEVSSKRMSLEGGKGKPGVNVSLVHEKYGELLGTAGRELFTQFFIRMAKELSGCILGEFSKVKILQGSAFDDFRKHFNSDLRSLALMPANTFDNVRGEFPIGFFVWRVGGGDTYAGIEADVYDAKSRYCGKKSFSVFSKKDYINAWISSYKRGEDGAVGYMDGINGNDFQHNNIVYILNSKKQLPNPRGIWVSAKNLIPVSVYHSVRHAVEASWLNDRDQFLSPNNGWEPDGEFQGDCLVFTLFHSSIRIKSEHGVNHWIPFTEEEVGAQDCFASHFMSDFLKGKKNGDAESFPRQMELATPTRSGKDSGRASPIAGEIAPFSFTISTEAKAVLDAGRELWRYYHRQPKANPNASYYDIRKHFQGMKVTAKGKEMMNATSDDEGYNERLAALKAAMKELAAKIQPKVYEYGFLKK